jgi:HEAT repeat protein
MDYATHIVFTNAEGSEDLAAFEKEMRSKTLGDRIYACQSLNESAAETSLAKLFVLYLSKERDVTNEIQRIFSFTYPVEKTLFLVKQLDADDKEIVYSALTLIKLLKTPLAIPYIQEIFNLEDIELSKRIIAALGAMADPQAVKMIVSALDTENEELLNFTIQVLSHRTQDVGWHTFKKLLEHSDKRIRREAAFAIAVRRDKRSAASMARAIETEIDSETKHALITYSGMIPGRQLLMPLLNMSAHDPDNKTRLLASRALYRIQGIILSKDFFHLRKVEDPDIRAEVIARLGQFGVEEDSQKKYIREELAKATTLNIVQACVQALGYTAERSDVDTLMGYLKHDPLTGYNAALALTRLWRSQDCGRVLEAIKVSTSAMQRQVFLKFLIHRRGLGIESGKLLEIVRWLFENDANINVHYLAAMLLEHAPSPETIVHLLRMNQNIEDFFVKEATATALRHIIKENDEMIIALSHTLEIDQFLSLIQFIPRGKKESFYRDLAAGIFDRETHVFDEETLNNVCDHAYVVLLMNLYAMKQFLSIAGGTFWERAFLQTFHDNATKDMVNSTCEELMDLLDTDDENIRILILERLKDVNNPKLLPKCMAIAEGSAGGTASALAREIVSSFGKRGIV